MKDTEELMLYQVASTPAARLYRNAAGAELWIPRSVCPRVTKLPKQVNGMEQHLVEVQSWFLKQHPWPKTSERGLL